MDFSAANAETGAELETAVTPDSARYNTALFL